MKAFEIAKKDLRIEFRTKGTLNLMILFALITSMMFSVSIPVSLAERTAPSLLWLVFLFVGMLGYSRAFLREVETETLDGLKISPIAPTSVLIGKIIYNLVLMIMIEVIVLPIFVGLFNLDVANPPLMILSITLGNLGFVIVVSSLSILVIKSKMREMLLPVLIFPVVFPIITSTILAVRKAISGDIVGITSPLALISGFSIMMFVVACLTFEYAFTD